MAFRITSILGEYNSDVTGALQYHDLNVLIEGLEFIVGDMIIISGSVDGNRTIVTPAGWTILSVEDGFAGTLFSYIKKCVTSDELLPTIDIGVAETFTCTVVQILGTEDLAVDCIGASSYRTGAGDTPTWNSITTTRANSAVLYLGAMDADNMLSIGSKTVISSVIAGANTSIVGYEFVPISGTATGEQIGTASLPDGWGTFTVEILDHPTVHRVPTYFANPAGATIDSTLYTTNDITFRDAISASGDSLIDGENPSVYTFEGADVIVGTTVVETGTELSTNASNKVTDGPKQWDWLQWQGCQLEITTGTDAGTYDIEYNTDDDVILTVNMTATETNNSYNIIARDTIPLVIDDSDDRKVFKLTGANLPTGLVSGNYYYLKRINATHIALVDAEGLDKMMSNTTAYTTLVDMTAVGSGTCTLTECGITLQSFDVEDYDNRTSSHYSLDVNYGGSARKFITPYDATDKIIGFSKGMFGYVGVSDAIYVFIDTTSDWKAWKLDDSSTLSVSSEPTQGLIDVENNQNFYKESGTLDHTDIEYMVMLYRFTSNIKRPKYFNGSPYEASPLVVLGGDSVNDVTLLSAYTELNTQIQGTSANPSSLQYLFLHSLVFGNGIDDLSFIESEKSLAFPPLADGVTSFDAYLVSLGVGHKLKATDTVSFKNSQIGAALPWDYTVDAVSSSSADIDYSGTTLVFSTVTLQSGETRTGMLFVGGNGIIHNDATITNSTFTNVDRAAGYLVLTTTHNISDCAFKADVAGDYAMEIDTAGTYALDGITFTGFTTDINVTETTGTVTINISGGGDTPTYTTAGATIIISNSVDVIITVKNMAGIEIENARVRVLADVGGDLPEDTIIINELTNVNGIASESFNFTNTQPIKGVVRKASGTPNYKEGVISGEITSSGYTTTILLILDE